MDTFNIILTIILAAIALVSAIAAWRSAGSAKKSAEAALKANTIAKADLKKRIIEKSIKAYPSSDWKRTLYSFLDATTVFEEKEKKEMEEIVRKAIKQK